MISLESDLGKHGCKRFSQNDEDGILDFLFRNIPPVNWFFVEFGVGPPWGSNLEQTGLEANCRLLKENGWHGLFMDANLYPEPYDVKQEFVTALNINLLLSKYRVPVQFDLISIDVDGQDFWVWSNLMCLPQVVLIEYNANLPVDASLVVPYQADFVWDGTKWFGASLLALNRLGISKGYVLVYANGVNAFFVRRDLLANPQDFIFEKIYRYRDLHSPGKPGRPWTKI